MHLNLVFVMCSEDSTSPPVYFQEQGPLIIWIPCYTHWLAIGSSITTFTQYDTATRTTHTIHIKFSVWQRKTAPT